MSQINQSTKAQDVPKSIIIFFQIGWSIIGLTIIVTIMGLSTLLFYSPGDYVSGLFSDYFVQDDHTLHVPIFSYLRYILEMLTLGLTPGFLMIGMGYHLKKVWQSSHYPW